MRYKAISAYTAGVLSILLIFTLFSLLNGIYEFDYGANLEFYLKSKQDEAGTMNNSLSQIPFKNTRFLSAVGADTSEGNKLLNVWVFALGAYVGAISILKAVRPSAVSDKLTKFFVRLLI